MRERAEPTPPRPAFFTTSKIVACVVLLMVALFAGAGYLVWRAMNRPPNWQQHESANGGYRVDLPGPVRHDLGSKAQFDGRAPRVVEGTIHRGNEYVVAWGDFPGGRNHLSDDQVMDAALNAMKGMDAELVSQEPVQVGPFTGREVVMSTPDQGIGVFRLVVTTQRIYIFGVGGQTRGRDDPNVRHFLESFEITHEPSLAVVRAREEAARRAKEAEETRRKEEERKKEEARLAAERAAKIRAHEQKRKEANDLYKNELYSGPPIPSMSVVRKDRIGVFNYTFDRESWNRGVEVQVEGWASTGPPMIGAMHGPGVSGKAAYITAGVQPPLLSGDDRSMYSPFSTVRQPDGFTLTGWVRVRYQPITLISIVGSDDVKNMPVAEITVGRTHVTALVEGRGKPVELKHAWTRDDKWHSVVLVRDAKTNGGQAILYFDGVRVASVNAEMLPLPNKLAARLGSLKYSDPDWPGVPDVDGKLGSPHKEDFVGAIDECAFVGRLLTDAEIRILTGTEEPPDAADRKQPPPPIDLTIKPEKRLGTIAAVAFDPARGCVWVVDEAGVEKATRLRKLTYPGFEEKASYELRGAVSACAFDLPRNRLYLAVGDRTGTPKETPLLSWPTGIGHIHRYDLDTLRPQDKVLVPDHRCRDQFACHAIVVSPDGKTVYFAAATREEAYASMEYRSLTGHLYRMTDNLEQIEKHSIVGNNVAPHRLELSPDGHQLKFHAWAARSGRVNLYAVDTQTWVELLLAEPDDYPFDWVSVSEKRTFLCGRSNIVWPNSRHAGGPPKWRGRGRGINENSAQYLGALADGQYLVTSEADPSKTANRVRVYSTYEHNEKPGDWKVWGEFTSTREHPVGGPFWTSPDGKFLVFRSGQVLRLQSKLDLTPNPEAVKRMIALPPDNRAPLAPMPHEKLNVGFVPRASEIKGLRLYLDCDELPNHKLLRDAITGKFAGKAGDAEEVFGPRGKALRLTTQVQYGNDPSASGIVLYPDRFRIDEGKPFTVAMWARIPKDELKTKFSSSIFSSRWRKKPESMGFGVTLGPRGAALFAGSTSTGRATSVTNGHIVSNWHHYAIVRGDDNKIHLHVDGEKILNQTDDIVRGAVNPEQVFILQQGSEKYVVEVDEFCLFGRALSTTELKRLAGRGEK